MVAEIAGLADGTNDGIADGCDVGFGMLGFDEVALVGLSVGADTGLVDGFVVCVNNAGFADGSDVDGFAEGVLVGLTAVGFREVGSSVTGWVDGFVDVINNVGRDVGFAVGTAVDGLADGIFVDGTVDGLRVVGLNVGLFATGWVDGFVVGVQLGQVSITRQIFPLPSSLPLDMVSDTPPETQMRLNLTWTMV